MEGAEECENPNKVFNRRSSILKRPKNRNSSEETDVTDTFTDITLSKPARRVSFASSNFIKPFVADPEKNTIWDTTYEEDVNHTNSTQSSQNSCSKVGEVHLGSVTPAKTLLGANITNWSVNDMELTADLLIDKENIPQSLTKRISIVDFAKKLSSNSVVPTFDLPPITSQLSDLNAVREPCGENSTRLLPQTMEFTCQNLGSFIKSNTNLGYLNRDNFAQEIEMNSTEVSICEKTEKSRSEKVKSFCHTTTTSLDMEFTGLAPVMPNKELKEICKEDMEFTCQISQREVSKLCHSDQSTCQVLSEKETVFTSGSDLEFTCQISTSPPRIYPKEANRSEVENRVGTNLEFLSGKETVLTSGNDMEFTCQVSTSPLNICPTEANRSEMVNHVGTDMEVTCQTPGVMNDEMEFTCQVPKLEKNSNLNITLRADDHNEDTNMEMEIDVSCQVSANSIPLKSVDVEFVCHVPIIDDVRQDDMEFTCQIPNKTNDIMLVVEDDDAKDNMEFTCQVPTQHKDLKSDGEDFMGDRVNQDNLCQISVNNVSKTDKTIDTSICQVGVIDRIRQTSTLVDLEFTPQIFKPEKKSKCDSVGNGYTETNDIVLVIKDNDAKENMEFTCQIPTQNEGLRSDGEDLMEDLVNKDNMCQISASNVSKTDKIIAKSICQVTGIDTLTDIEFTCQIPKPEKNSRCDSVGNRYTDSDMEYTCQIKQKNSRDEEVEKCVSSDTTCQTLSKTAKSLDDLEFACQIFKTKNNTKGDSVRNGYTETNDIVLAIKDNGAKENMEFTCQIPTQNEGLRSDGEDLMEDLVNKDNMCQMSASNVSKTDKIIAKSICQVTGIDTLTDMEFTCQIPKPEKNSRCDSVGNRYTDSDMEYTCQIKQKNSRDEEVEKCVSSDTTCQTLSKTAKSLDDLEFACQIFKPKNNTKGDSVGNRYTDSDMEYACEIKQKNSRDEEVGKCVSSDTTCQTLSKTAKSVDDLEFTCQIPKPKNNTKDDSVGDRYTDSDMEYLCQIKQKNSRDEEVEKCVSSATTCQTLSKTAKSVDDLEFTCQISKPKNNTNSDRVGNRYTDFDMEYTCQIKQNNCGDEEVEKCVSTDTTCQTLSKTTKSVNDLEFTCQVPTDRIHQGKPSRFTDMESTCHFPKMEKDLEFTKVGLGSNGGQVNEKQANTKCMTEKSIEDMEIDQSFPFENEPDEVNFSKKKSLINVELDQASENKIDVGQNVEKFVEEMISRSEDCKDTLKTSFNVADKSDCRTPNLTTENLKQSRLPVRTRCSWIKTPESFGKKQKIERGSQSVLFPENTFVVSTHDSSAQKTPEPSFHINFNMSSGIDDTQHLLHLTYAKTNPSCFIASRLEGNDESLALNLEDTRHVSRPNLTSIDSNWDKTIEVTRNSPEVDVPRRLAHINDTYMLKNKTTVQKIQSDDDVEENLTVRDEDCDVEGHDSSLGLMSEEVLNDDLPNAEDGGRRILGELKQEELPITSTQEDLATWAKSLKKWDIKIRRVSEISDLLERVNKQNEHITEYLENFKFRPMRIPKQFVIKEKTRKSIDSLRESSDASTFCVISTEEKIRKHQEICQNCWTLEKIDDDNLFHFSTLFGTLLLSVRLDSESDEVIGVEKTNKLARKSTPLAHYVMKYMMDKMSDGQIRSAIGQHYDVLSLLDYVQMIMLRAYHFQKKFMLYNYFLSMDENFVAKFKMIRVRSGLSVEVFVNVSDVENLNCHEDIKVVSLLGTVNEREIKNCATNCPKGLDFFASFVECLQEYLGVAKLKREEKVKKK